MSRVRTAETSNEPRQPSWLEKKTNTALCYPCRGRTIGASGTSRPDERAFAFACERHADQRRNIAAVVVIARGKTMGKSELPLVGLYRSRSDFGVEALECRERSNAL